MKIRVGFGLGTRSLANTAASLGTVVDACETLGWDSLWFSDRVTGEAPDPIVAMTFAAARTNRLKLGTSVLVLPGRNPVLVAKQLASLDRVAESRLLPAFGLGAVDPVEQAAFGVTRADRAPWLDEALPLLHELWTGEPVTHHGERFRLDGIAVRPTPTQAHLDCWLGGIAPSELRRCGRLGDGWLPSFCTVAEVEVGIPTVAAEAERHDRAIDPEHYGVLIAYRRGPLPDVVGAFLSRRRPDLDPATIVPEVGDLAATIERFVSVGASKFVVLPLTEPDDWDDELADVGASVLPLQR